MMMEQIANRYEILSLIGQGGMADVYKAKDTILNRIVAIKVMLVNMKVCTILSWNIFVVEL